MRDRSPRWTTLSSARALPWLALLLPALLAGCSSDGDPGSRPGAPPVVSGRPSGLVTSPVDETRLVTLVKNTGPKPSPLYDLGAVDDARVLQGMQLVLKRSAAAEAELQALIDEMHTPGSPSFHKWLTPQEFAARFGVTAADVAIVTGWLESHGFHVEGVPTSRMFVSFTGTAGQVREAFHTEIHALNVRNANGEPHITAASDPQIPQALSPVIFGVHGLHDFMPVPQMKSIGAVQRIGHSGQFETVGPSPDYTTGAGPNYALAPADLAKIYNFPGPFPGTAANNGSGQTVVVVEDGTIKTPADVANFRSLLGLPVSAFAQKQPAGAAPCTAPGVNGAEGEAALDVEWAGAAAPGATIELDACTDNAVFGGLAAVQNLINGAKPPPIISMSYGECESLNGVAANGSYVSTYQQAAAEGVSIFVSAGDNSAAGCDQAWGDTYSTLGISSNAFGSTPYNLSAGGTDFMDKYDSKHGGPAQSTYWNAVNTSVNGSAKSYIPEIPWNNSCASSMIFKDKGFTTAYGPATATTGYCNTAAGQTLVTNNGSVGGSGGPSIFTPQPSWQTGVQGLPTQSGGMRYMPDVSLFAANGVWGHYYIFCMSDVAQGGSACSISKWGGAGGTSFVSPILGGVQALLNQAAGGVPQGNPAPMYYQLAAAQYGLTGSPACNSGTGVNPVAPAATCVFYDVQSGDNDVPCMGPTNCFGTTATLYGALSTSNTSFAPAYATTPGWDFATGLGTLNVTNLVNAWSATIP